VTGGLERVSEAVYGHGSELRTVLEEACLEEGCSAGALTVLAAQHDPFRVDTPARRRDGEWLAVQAERLGLGARTIHLRGLHYMLVSGEAIKPNGKPYTNTDADWIWLQEDCAKAARWLGYLPFRQIIDARNSEPIVNIRVRTHPSSYIAVGVEIEIPGAHELEPRVDIDDFVGVRPYKLVLYGEKTSLQEVLVDVAAEHDTDLYLPAGEISNTLLYQMASIGANDGRPIVVLTFSDCDPAGWQMPISIGRKLQGFRALEFPELTFQVYRVALTPDQVRSYGLPSTPLKATERRADRWLQEMRVEQTEIDALAALNPELLRQIALDAVEPFYDYTLVHRVDEARAQWLDQAQARLNEQIDQEQINRIRAEAAAKLATLRDEIDAINEALRVETGHDFDLPPMDVPQAELDRQINGLPLIDSGWPWAEQTRALKASKAYQE
jgi:hypothetical protein